MIALDKCAMLTLNKLYLGKSYSSPFFGHGDGVGIRIHDLISGNQIIIDPIDAKLHTFTVIKHSYYKDHSPSPLWQLPPSFVKSLSND